MLRFLIVSVALVAMLMADASAQAQESIVLYSGRSRSLVDPIVKNFEQATGVRVQTRYYSDAQLLAVLREEGGHSPADVVWMNTAGALGAANNAGLLAELPASLREKPMSFVPSSGRWVPGTVRFRVLAYSPQRVETADLPESVMDVKGLEPFRGRIGWTPAYSSFQDFITAMRLVHGRETAMNWLKQMQTLEPKAYPSNTPMLQALAAGEIDVALTNHYYVIRLQQQHLTADAQAQPIVAMHHFKAGDVGNLALVTGAGVLAGSEKAETAHRFLNYLLEPEAQRYAVTNLHEYPVTEGVELPEHMLPMEQMRTLSPELDLERLRELEETLALLREAGLF